MNILLYYLYGGGGALENMRVLYRALAERPSVSRLTVVCSATSPLCELGVHPKVKLILRDYSPMRELNRLVMAVWGLKALVVRERPDVVLAINLSSYVRLGVPAVLSVNNSYQVYPIENIHHHPKGRIAAAVLRSFFRLALSQTDGVILQTELMRQYTLGIAGRHLPSWVIGKSVEDVADVSFQPLPRAAQRMAHVNSGHVFSFFYAATPVKHKNHRVLYKAMDILRLEGVPVRLLLTLSAEEVRATGGELADSLIASGHIAPLGFLRKAHLRTAYEVSDACVMPSLLESLSSAHIEAMAWAKPQIAADLPYARDLCGEAALYCQADNAAAWAEAMRQIFSDENLRTTLVKAGRRVMQTMPHSVADTAAQLEAALQDVIRLYKA